MFNCLDSPVKPGNDGSKPRLGALVAARGKVLEKGSLVEIQEGIGVQCERGFAAVVEQKTAQLELLEVDLVPLQGFNCLRGYALLGKTESLENTAIGSINQ